MKVWVLEPIGRDARGIEGVFATAEAAKAFIAYAEWCDEADEHGDWYTKDPSDAFRVHQVDVRT